MWVHFNFICGKETQVRLHKMLRLRILDLKSRSLIEGAVLTYHWHKPRAPTDSLYFCLNVLSMSEPRTRSKQLCEESVNEIPDEIKHVVRFAVEAFDKEFLDRLEIFDYEIELMCNNAPFEYGGASIEEIIRFASKGTEIALEILGDYRTRNKAWKSDNEIAEYIMKLINERLTTQRERNKGLHFVCNPLGLWNLESYLLSIVGKTTQPNSQFALNSLYQVEDMK